MVFFFGVIMFIKAIGTAVCSAWPAKVMRTTTLERLNDGPRLHCDDSLTNLVSLQNQMNAVKCAN